jgi:hypothetical protein
VYSGDGSNVCAPGQSANCIKFVKSEYADSWIESAMKPLCRFAAKETSIDSESPSPQGHRAKSVIISITCESAFAEARAS